MITDSLANSGIYQQALPQLACCFNYVAGLPHNAPTGRTDLKGERLFALVQRYRTQEAATRRFESHDRHVDLHYVLRGSESLQVQTTARLQPTAPANLEKDYTLYADPSDPHNLLLNAGDFALFFPHEGHKTGCIAGIAMDVTKVVIKIRLSE